MSRNDLFDYMKSAAQKIQAEYDRIQKRALEDPGTAGDNGEENWANLLREWLPAHYHVVTKGRIMNTDGECGPQVDVLVLSPSYPQVLLDKKEYLEGGVVAAFECKLTLTAAHVRNAVRTAAHIRSLSRPERKGTPYKELHTRLRYGLLAHSHSWQGAASTPIQNIEKNLRETESKIVQNPKELLDFVCVSDLGAWHTRKMIFVGQQLLSQIKVRYEKEDIWNVIQRAGGVIEAAHVCSAAEYQSTDEAKATFTPVGSFLAALLESLSWEDESMRALAEYFIIAQLGGAGQGLPVMWPLSVLSDELAAKLVRGGSLVSGERWSEWSMIF
ncbi:DUF6602 domain-containing protein [Azospirillum brasilense]|uniref:DUF6602 domain-containing protein n=1 Tax=Azospirillum brasilense TaxID=192 RepID=UPI0011EBE41A|nr:DUF6602 domain-containing protein [Azospirillum brasilense]